MSTRRGKQFNSMVHRQVDPLTGARRDSVLMSKEDAGRLSLRDGDLIRLVSTSGTFLGRVQIDKIKPGNLQVHWPEGNGLLSLDEIDIASREPDYNAIVKLEKVEETIGLGLM